MSYGESMQEHDGAWPAFADLLAGSTLLFLVLFAVIAVPALQASKAGKRQRDTLARIDSTLRADSFDVQNVGDHVLVTIGGDATFSRDSSNLRDMKREGRAVLRRLARALEGGAIRDSIDQIQVVGHTSADGKDEHNWRLSSQRATSVALFLIDSAGLDQCRVTALGRSRLYPIDTAWARHSTKPNPKDRRIELEIRPILVGSKEQQDRRNRCVATPGQE